MSLFEARSASDYKNQLYNYIAQRYGEHEADTVMDDIKRMGFKSFKQHMATKFVDSKVDHLVKSMGDAAVAAINARKAAENPPSKKDEPSDKERTFIDPETAADKASKIDAMRAARNNKSYTPPPTPKGSGHSLGQLPIKDQPSQTAGIQAQKIEPNIRGGARSGLVNAQRHVDKVTKEKGAAEGEKLAKMLGVPSTKDRTVRDEETGEEKVQVWNVDRVMKFLDADQRDPEEFHSKSDSEKRAAAAKSAKNTAAGKIDPDRLEKIKQGILQRNAAPKKLGPDHEGSFDGEVWKPSGREGETVGMRADPVTGNFIRFKQAVNPKRTGNELQWLKSKKQWVEPSVYAAEKAKELAQRQGNNNDDSDDEEDAELAARGFRKI